MPRVLAPLTIEDFVLRSAALRKEIASFVEQAHHAAQLARTTREALENVTRRATATNARLQIQLDYLSRSGPQ